MSVGPGKVRVFRIEAKKAIKASSSVSGKSVSPKPKKEPKRESPAAGYRGKNPDGRVVTGSRNVAPPASKATQQPKSTGQGKRPEGLEAIRVKHRLVLSEKQKERLASLFSAPNALASLLRAYPQKLVTPSDASAFLLSNRKELDTYINPAARGRAVDLLTELLLQWSGSPPDSIGIDFDEVSLTPDQKVYLPLDGVRLIEVVEPSLLLEQRIGRFYNVPFTLFEEGKQFFVAFTLAPKSPNKQPPRHFEKKDRVNLTKEALLEAGLPLPYINGLRYPREPRQRILFSKYSGVFSGGLKAMNWGSLSGWGVNGGLPSLGKNSR